MSLIAINVVIGCAKIIDSPILERNAFLLGLFRFDQIKYSSNCIEENPRTIKYP
jgi:hypothetical protein